MTVYAITDTKKGEQLISDGLRTQHSNMNWVLFFPSWL